MGTPNLRIRREIAKIRRHGQIFRGRWVHVRIGTSEMDLTLISIRKKFGNAVRRNRIRRQVRAICSELIPLGHSHSLMIISIGDHAFGVSYAELRLELHLAFQKLGLIDS
ncbi:MAG: ribonuclease P protein component [Candidatus Latescibacteria bacterium]|nr:ribonuclease P protein component [Candidatus Latescibacterota bacterium]